MPVGARTSRSRISNRPIRWARSKPMSSVPRASVPSTSASDSASCSRLLRNSATPAARAAARCACARTWRGDCHRRSRFAASHTPTSETATRLRPSASITRPDQPPKWRDGDESTRPPRNSSGAEPLEIRPAALEVRQSAALRSPPARPPSALRARDLPARGHTSSGRGRLPATAATAPSSLRRVRPSLAQGIGGGAAAAFAGEAGAINAAFGAEDWRDAAAAAGSRPPRTARPACRSWRPPARSGR